MSAIAFSNLEAGRKSCTKHGPYEGPYCPLCYRKAISGVEDSKTSGSAQVEATGCAKNWLKNEFEVESVRLRKEKDQFFRTDPDSPIQPERRSGFKGLNYFNPSEEYRVAAVLERFENPQPVQIVTSTGTDQPYLRYGVLRFELVGRSLQLIVYKSTDDPFARSLFLPFSDETSGSETYGPGRYLDLEEQGGDAYELDFNQAYNPYCAYNDQYTCPIPPGENKLSVKILAGEKNYK